MCGLLLKTMYGTRDAAQNWEYEYRDFMEAERFIVGKSTPCAFRHPERKLRVVIHGDDFTVLARESELDWFWSEVQKRFECKHRGRLGPGDKDMKEIRIITWTNEGIEYEGD